MSISKEKLERLEEIKNEMKDLLAEAEEMVRRCGDSSVWQRAKSYWVGHIATALDDESNYVGSSGWTLQQTIDEIPVEGEEDDEEDEE
jgi:hypothetical protein